MLHWKQARATVESYVEGWRSSNREAWLSLFADDAVLVDPAGSPPIEGKEAIAGFWDKTHSLGMKLNPQVSRIVVCGAEAMLVFRMTATAPDGSVMSLDVCDLFSFDEQGRIRQLRAFWDKGCMTMISAA